MSKDKTLCCYENDIFGWTRAFAGTTYGHMKSLKCRLTTDKNKVSLNGRGMQLLDEYIMAVCKRRSDEPEVWTIEEKGPMKTVLKVSKDSISLEIVLNSTMQVAKIDVKDLQAFRGFIQNLNRDSYTELMQKGLPTHGIPTVLLAAQESTNCKKQEPNEVQESADYKKPITTDDIEDRDLCKICLENELDILVMPCKHLCLCAVCSANLEKCPMCRTHITEFVKVYKC